MLTKSGKTAINTFTGGMNLDADLAMMPSNQYRYSINTRVSSSSNGTLGSLSNIEGSSQMAFSIGANDTVIAVSSVRDIGIRTLLTY
jgi:hypothetical protein